MCLCPLLISLGFINKCADNLTPCWPAAVCSLSQKSSVACGHQLQDSQRIRATTGPAERGISLTAHLYICNKLQEVHSSRLVHSTCPCDWFPQSGAKNFCHRVQWQTLMPVIASDEPQPRGSHGCTSRPCPAGIWKSVHCKALALFSLRATLP